LEDAGCGYAARAGPRFVLGVVVDIVDGVALPVFRDRFPASGWWVLRWCWWGLVVAGASWAVGESGGVAIELRRKPQGCMARILVIEDNHVLCGMVLRMLVAAGHEVQAAVDGKVGLACYRQQRSDLVITDILMPETEGLETIRALRRHDPGVKIIAMSGADRGRAGGYLELAQKFGARRILSKPFTQDELLTAVAEVLTVRSES
jgi:CheY-like chemotaxis protein